MKAIVTLLILLTLFSQTAFARNYTQLSLPEGAKARLGKGSIAEIAYSPDGTRLAVASSIGIWLYDTEPPHQEIALLTGHTWEVRSVAFSPDGRTLASGSNDDTIRLWDAVSGAHKQTLTGHTSGVFSVAFSPDGRTLASGSNDDTIRLWDAISGRTQADSHGAYELGLQRRVSVRMVAPSLVGVTTATIRLWDVAIERTQADTYGAYRWCQKRRVQSGWSYPRKWE